MGKNMQEMRFEFKVSLKKVWYKKTQAQPAKNRALKLRSSLLMAYQMQEYIETGRIETIRDFCKWIPVSHSRICQIHRLLLLAPDIQEDIISKDDEMIATLSEDAIKKIPMQHDWDRQRKMWKKYYEPLSNN